MGLGLPVACVLLVACVRIGTFSCDDDSQCTLDGLAGLCLEPGYCALPDTTCGHGYRWHERGVPDPYVGECIGMPVDTASSSSSGGAASFSSSSDGSPSSGGSTSDTLSGSDGSSSTTGSECGDYPCPCTQSLATGFNHVCVVRTDRRVVCWGDNSLGQLGQGSGDGSEMHPQLVVIPGEVLADEVFASNNGTCARGSDGTLWCWGYNNHRQITTPGDWPDEMEPYRLPVDGVHGAFAQSAEHTCVGDAMIASVRCLGSGNNQELGGGGDQPVEVDLSNLSAMNPVAQLAAGVNHSCALADGEVWCWGRDNYGQLGQELSNASTAEPVLVPLSGEAGLLVAGNNHNCVAVDDGATVECWGRGNQGQIGDGDNSNDSRQIPTPLERALPGRVAMMSARGDTTCALLDDGTVWCWGGRAGRWLGTDVDNNVKLVQPTPVQIIEELPETIVEIALGQAHLCGRAESGRLWCWGDNSHRELGPTSTGEVTVVVELDVWCPPQ
ncbi:MAG: hypothetical protein AAGF11_31345 [Myxococcota bacterium]